MSQICITPKTDHKPEIERYYDEERPELVMRLFRCELCGALLDRDVIDRRQDEADELFDPEFEPEASPEEEQV